MFSRFLTLLSEDCKTQGNITALLSSLLLVPFPSRRSDTLTSGQPISVCSEGSSDRNHFLHSTYTFRVRKSWIWASWENESGGQGYFMSAEMVTAANGAPQEHRDCIDSPGFRPRTHPRIIWHLEPESASKLSTVPWGLPSLSAIVPFGTLWTEPEDSHERGKGLAFCSHSLSAYSLLSHFQHQARPCKRNTLSILTVCKKQ